MAKAAPRKRRARGRTKGEKEAAPRSAPDLPKKDHGSTEVSIAAAKGRPMLTWVGKRPLRHVTAFPAQLVEVFDPAGDAAKRPGGLLFHGDNKEVLAHLLANGYRGKVDLIYIDPPFDSGADYVRKVSLRGPKGTAKLDGESYTLGEQIQYTDIWANDNYLQFMYERLALLRELMAEHASIVVHCDWNVVHLVRCVLDELFQMQNFVNEIVWQHAVIGAGRGIYRRLPKAHETLLWYVKGGDYAFETEDAAVRVPYKDRITKNLTKDEKGWFYTRGRTGTDNPWSRDPRYLKTYVDVDKGKLVHDVWDDISTYRAQGDEYLGFPTQKPGALIERVIALASEPDDLVLDCFVGSGTAVAEAQKLGRRWIGCDINKGAVQTTSKRLQGIMSAQIEQAKQDKQLELAPGEAPPAPEPAQLSFSVHRVNDYDLAIQHVEAVNLACEHVGVERKRTDAYFDGTLGRKLVKVVPFNHPLTPLDLHELKRELDGRPDEDRDVVMICLGKDPASDAWIADWNRLRKGKDAVNRVEVIELRSDPKYGKFFAHQPATARVKLRSKGDTAVVEIEDFISPGVVERLHAQEGLLQPKIEDWRAMVDSVQIDFDYDGAVFRVGLADVPAKKYDFVAGRYELPGDRCGKRVGVKITDMLGEEVLVALPRDTT